ncbi:hypothetical protein LINPERPRIM_LOCUS36219 [Linum perenne]
MLSRTRSLTRRRLRCCRCRRIIHSCSRILCPGSELELRLGCRLLD